MLNCLSAVVSSLFLLGAMASPAWAATSSITSILFTGQPFIHATGTYVNNSGTLRAKVETTPSPSVTVDSLALGDGIHNYAVYADFQYSVSVNGPANVTVPLDIAFSASIDSYGQAFLGWDNGTLWNSFPFYSPGNSFSYSGTAHVDVTTGDEYTVDLNARTSVLQHDLSKAMIDPIFTIDPQFFLDNPNFDPSDFSFTFSEGVGNSSVAAGEPASLALLVTGVVSVLPFARRRRSGR